METLAATEEKSFEKRVEELGALGIPTHEVRVQSYLYGVDQMILFTSEEEARTFAHVMVEAGRAAYGEQTTQGKYIDDYEGVADTCTEEEAVVRGWRVMVFAHYTEGRNGILISSPTFLFGHRFGANRVADPTSKVFLRIYGRDCDGYGIHKVQEYRDLHAAAEGMDEEYKWADGVLSWSVITKDEFETF